MPTFSLDFMLPLLNNPILIAVYIILTTAIINLITVNINNSFQKEREKVSKIEDIYAGCIKNLATVSTLSRCN
ncbi:hypothetical protein NIES267_37260 [Calothrix parasitica NIES-267]|uniref:Uncharacterized protein n=1 Tax=Calothrix parasitica NIES-267 TaxID=1973488 RepID=A0A1Z4LSK8_9CYAN|nr:hypothetical protein NIES267_37260 [Calothrix parasitica NIES-267]